MVALNTGNIIAAADAIFQAGRLPGEGRVDPKYRLKRLVDARNMFGKLTPREQTAALFLAAVKLHPDLGTMTSKVIDLFVTFLKAKR